MFRLSSSKISSTFHASILAAVTLLFAVGMLFASGAQAAEDDDRSNQRQQGSEQGLEVIVCGDCHQDVRRPSSPPPPPPPLPLTHPPIPTAQAQLAAAPGTVASSAEISGLTAILSANLAAPSRQANQAVDRGGQTNQQQEQEPEPDIIVIVCGDCHNRVRLLTLTDLPLEAIPLIEAMHVFGATP